ncbi:MAG: hypothetical protein ETSY2_06955 [Candidatus Entotheonella gemina]|uniref:DUF29 domain-containing protein n=2 Tax=Candidatus Entotheonella TaxID=93171 RepID=W4ME11_9BACT|nr:MAG: hypothetical protein ETSY2_06955 [Candidatus Entotheonella gemina]
MHDWPLLASTNHYDTAVAIRDTLREGDAQSALEGLEELINALSRSDERALKSYLEVLIQHIIKWRHQPERRSLSWVTTIETTRDEIAELREDNPRFAEAFIRSKIWARALRAGHRKAEGAMGKRVPQAELSWEDVFETSYTLEPHS